MSKGIEKPKPTHLVSFYGVRCWFHEESGALWGVNLLCDKIIIPMAALHNVFSYLAGGGFPFPLKVIKRL